ncbi:hypothetical protein RRG08_042358 [Elysia crispata]|uniref:Uncharacterized protein n=1 Tax=Elysia crispata TaxID=231223 RepID=A0AAE1DDL6_9GAST|nr:hypothetical protein RRG08_042358 [Elysia crispata]
MTTHHSRWLWLTSFAPQRKYIADVMLHSLGISDRSHFSPVVSVASDEKLAMFTLQTPTLPNIVYCVVYMCKVDPVSGPAMFVQAHWQ